MTGYVVHYSDGVSNWTEIVAASSANSDITNLTNCLKYSLLVEATSDHLSGESEILVLELGKDSDIYLQWLCVMHFTTPYQRWYRQFVAYNL